MYLQSTGRGQIVRLTQYINMYYIQCDVWNHLDYLQGCRIFCLSYSFLGLSKKQGLKNGPDWWTKLYNSFSKSSCFVEKVSKIQQNKVLLCIFGKTLLQMWSKDESIVSLVHFLESLMDNKFTVTMTLSKTWKSKELNNYCSC